MRATHAIIHLDHFHVNLDAAAAEAQGAGAGAAARAGICVPVKADAYGHGAVPIARAALDWGARWLAVATVEEGAELRAAGIAPAQARILLFSQICPGEMPDVVNLSLSPFVSDIDAAAALDRAAAKSGKRLETHLTVDTGMSRLGCRPEDAADLARFITSSRSLSLGGMATHFAVADSPAPADVAFTRAQITRFREAVASVRDAGIDPGMIHSANSGALCLHPDARFDLVRPGLFLYGCFPASNTLPVMELRSRITFIKWIRRGDSVSYGRTWTAPEDTIIATIPVGYADGLPRAASGKLHFLVRGQRALQVGRICMDQCMINLSPATNAQRWDEVTVFSSAIDVASASDRIPYEITCGITRRVPRVYVS